VPLGWLDLLIAIATGALVFFAIELEKLLLNRKK
jgi:hypothetical protein